MEIQKKESESRFIIVNLEWLHVFVSIFDSHAFPHGPMIQSGLFSLGIRIHANTANSCSFFGESGFC